MGEAKELADFTDDEIRTEYIERDLMEKPTLGDFDNDEIRDEFEKRFSDPDEGPDNETIELIAEAARVSPHAKRAYEILRERWPHILRLDVAQLLVSGRMGQVA